MSLVSNAFNVTVQAQGTQSALATAAANASAGSWTSFTMGNLTSATFTGVAPGGGEPSNINNFGNRLCWDPVHKRLLYAGTSHTNTGGPGVVGAGSFEAWDDATNQWSRETYNGWHAGSPGHSYYHLAVNKLTGDFYFRNYNGQNVWRRPFGSTGEGAWTSNFSTITNSGDWSNQVAGALEWFPELNSGSGGLVFYNQLGAARSNAALTSWTWQTGTAEGGQYHNWSAYSGGFVYFGGGTAALGSGNNSGMWRMNSAGVVTQMPDTPIQASAASAAVLPHPNGVGLLLFTSSLTMSPTGPMWYFDGSTWTSAGTHQIGVNDGMWVGCAIPEYGVVVIVRNQAGTANPPTCVLFKPAASSTFTTTFTSNENPIGPLNGGWRNGGTNGTAWHNNQVSGGHAYATAIDSDAGGVTDNVSVYTGTQFTSNQFAEGTIFKNAGYGAGVVTHELEVFVNMTINSNSITGYECYLNIAGNHTLVMWDGAHGVFVPLASNNAGNGNMPAYQDGDVMRIERVGSTINVYHRTAAGSFTLYTTYNSTNSTKYLNGNPGFGTNPATDAGGSPVISSAGFSRFSCGNM